MSIERLAVTLVVDIGDVESARLLEMCDDLVHYRMVFLPAVDETRADAHERDQGKLQSREVASPHE